MDQSRQAIRDLHTARSEPLFKFVVPEANSLKAKSNETRSRSFDALNIGLGWNSGFGQASALGPSKVPTVRGHAL